MAVTPMNDPKLVDQTHAALEIWYEEFCTTDEHYLSFNDTDEARPEGVPPRVGSLGDRALRSCERGHRFSLASTSGA